MLLSAVPPSIDPTRENAYPWVMTIELSKETEQSLKAYLAQKGLQKAAMVDVVEEAVEDFLFRQSLQEAHERNIQLDPEEVETLVENAVMEHRRNQPSR